MKQIDVSTPQYPNRFVDVDDIDFPRFSKDKWSVDKVKNKLYVSRSINTGDGKCRKVRMHREILSVTDGSIIVDHRDGNTFNNTRQNLRTCTKTQNTRNSNRSSKNTSGYKGVVWSKKDRRWVAQITVDRKYKYLGSFFCLIKAAKAYNEAALKYHGECARINVFKENKDGK